MQTPSDDVCLVGGACACGSAEPVNLAAWWRIGVGILIAANSMTVSLAVDTSTIAASERTVVNLVLAALALACLALLGWPLASGAWQALLARRVTLEALFLTGIVGAFTASAVAVVTGHGAAYFEVVSILLVVYSFGQQVAAAARERAIEAVVRWAPDAGEATVVLPGGGTKRARMDELEPGQVVRVAPGEMVPVDGVVVRGEAFVREAEMTGEPLAVVRRPGDAVWAATHAVDASLDVRVTAALGARRIDQVVAAVAAARSRPSRAERQADRLVQWFLPLVLGTASVAFVLWWWLEGWETGLFNAMAVLLVACPCALGLATPLAVWAALARLAGRGLVARGGEVVERLAEVDLVAFDKTGTLSGAEATLVDLVVRENAERWNRDAVRDLLAVVEAGMQHPVAGALRGRREPGTRFQLLGSELIPATGVRAVVREVVAARSYVVVVGTAGRVVGRNDESWVHLYGRLHEPGGARLLAVLVDGELVAAAAVDERLRESWPGALDELRAASLASVVMSGDSLPRVAAVGADRVLAELGPEDKLAEVRRLTEAGHRVLFVGDGVNDAAAMAASHASIAVADGTDLAREVADLTWHGGDLGAVPWAVLEARGVMDVIRGNLRLAVLYNLAGVALAVGGALHPVAAAVLMTCSSVAVTWRATGTLRLEQAEWKGEVALAALRPREEAA